jgi:predicted amino acid dehydrogenase
MTARHEETRMREHLAELRRGARGLGRDMEVGVEKELRNVETKISRFSVATGKGAKYLATDIEDDLARLGKALDNGMVELPGRVAGGIKTAGVAIGSGTARLAGATADALSSARQKAGEGTKNALARAAGVKRTPMREWRHPTESDSRDD